MQPSHNPFCLNQQIVNICSGLTSLTTHWDREQWSSSSLPSGPSWVWWWSWAPSSWGESTESASCPPPPTGRSKAPSNYPGCICACHLLPVHWIERSALTRDGYFHTSVTIINEWLGYKALPAAPAPASWDCEQRMRSSPPTEAPWSCTGSLWADR